MNKKIEKKLIELNSNFYKEIGEEFDQTRKVFWKGWEDLYTKGYLSFDKKLKVLDIACGNCRFADFLNTKDFEFDYLGIDNSEILLEKSSLKYKKINLDILSENLSNIFKDKTFDLVVMFGFMHHIPGSSLRKSLFKRIRDVVGNNGKFIFSVWDFYNDEKYKNRLIEPSEIGIKNEDLDKNDYILDWKRGKTSYRYCHQYNEDEISDLSIEENFELVDTFVNDGKSQKLNRYYVVKAV